jgi:hypothetical protein
MGLRKSSNQASPGPTQAPDIQPVVPDIAPAAPSIYDRLRDRLGFQSALTGRFAQAEAARIENLQLQTFAQQAAFAGINPDKESSGQQNNAAMAIAPSATDLRARLRAKPSSMAYNLLYADNPWVNLQNYGGMIWPYTPNITYNQDVQYDSLNAVHTNQEILAYSRTSAPTITVSGSFSSQTQLEARYNLACLHFLRLVTKMSFGASVNPQRGTPPPVLYFDAHGGGMFLNIPVVVKNFAITLPNDPDYVTVTASPQSKVTRVPAIFDISVSLTVQHTPRQLREWSIEKFRSGGYITSVSMKKAGWI